MEHSRRSAGFTLIELMIALTVAGVLLAIATPNLRVFLQNNRLSSASNDLLRSFQVARTEAIKRQRNVVVCASANPTATPPACSYGTFNGWIVFEDSNPNWSVDAGEPILERHALLDSSIIVKTDNEGIESYGTTGFANPAGARNPTHNILICDKRGNQDVGHVSVERAVLVTSTGRVRVSRVDTDVNNAASSTGGCP
jgi:type IV fimbrial biogenesis protein FimT